LINKNSKLLEFINCKLKNHPVLSSTENFFQRFSKVNVKSNQSLRDIVLDISSNNISEEMDTLCSSNEFLTLPRYIEQTKFIIEQYKLVADKILDEENLLKIKLSTLDSIQNKINSIQSLSHNEHYEELMNITEKYIGKIFDENNIEKDYNEIIANYRKFFYLREVIKTIRLPELTEKEPLCSICFNDQIQYTFNPCGHTFCSNCTKKQFNSCSICRTHISERIKIFFT
jgi:ATP-dependent Lon protease